MEQDSKQNLEAKYISSLMGLAKLCNTVLDDFVFELYDEGLQGIELLRRIHAIRKLAMTRKATDRFPSVRDIREAAGDVFDDPRDDKAKATELANRVWDAIERFGYNQPEEAEKYLGPIGWAFVNNSGRWVSICSIEGERTTYVAQWRDSIMSLLIKDRAGVPLGTAPALDYGKLNQLPDVVQKALQGASSQDVPAPQIKW